MNLKQATDRLKAKGVDLSKAFGEDPVANRLTYAAIRFCYEQHGKPAPKKGKGKK